MKIISRICASLIVFLLFAKKSFVSVNIPGIKGQALGICSILVICLQKVARSDFFEIFFFDILFTLFDIFDPNHCIFHW